MLLTDITRVSDLWHKQKEIQTQKEILKAMIKNSSTESLSMVMNDFYSKENINSETEIPELITYITEELADRKDNYQN